MRRKLRVLRRTVFILLFSFSSASLCSLCDLSECC